jgi:transposase
MRVEHTRYDSEFIENAVDLCKRSDRTFKAIAHSLGVPEGTLRYWYDQRVAKGKKRRRSGEVPSVITTTETPAAKIARLERENAALRKQVDSLETDREILKKAAAFFAKESE